MNKKPIIVGLSHVGTYFSHINYTVSSMYHLCDFIVVINGGYDIYNPCKGDNILLERDAFLLKEIDIDNKVRQFRAAWKGVNNIKKGKSEAGRDRNMSMAVQAAFKLGADWVLKVDSDEILHHNINRKDLENLVSISQNGKYGFRFSMQELWGTYKTYQSLPDWAEGDDHNYPSSNDAPQFYKPCLTDWYIGGSPVVSSSIKQYQKLFSYHVRSVPPTDVDPFEYFVRRYWYHKYIPRQAQAVREGQEFNIDFDVFMEECKKSAEQSVKIINSGKLLSIDPNAADPRIPKESPLVVEMGCKNYIKMMKNNS